MYRLISEKTYYSQPVLTVLDVNYRLAELNTSIIGVTGDKWFELMRSILRLSEIKNRALTIIIHGR